MQNKLELKSYDGKKISAVISKPSHDDKKIVILCHGFTVNKGGFTNTAIEQSLNEKNIATIKFDFRGHGESEGDFADITISNAVENIKTVFDFVKKEGFEKIGLFGSSFGGLASLLTASEIQEIKYLAVKSPVIDYKEVWELRMTEKEILEWKKNGFINYKNGSGEVRKLNYNFWEDIFSHNVLDQLKKIKIPSLIVHGTADTVVPVSQVKEAIKYLENGELKIIEGAGHKYEEEKQFQKMKKFVVDFFVDQMGILD